MTDALIAARPTIKPTDERDRHNRRVMLQRVKRYWLKGVLEESLHGAELIDLAMATRDNALLNSRAPGWEQGDAFDQPLPIGTPISQVFDAARGALLILGEPGAGKTTTLLQLVTDLVQRVERDGDHPIPVVFSLATWQNGRSLPEWIADELSSNYEVPRKLGQAWLDNGAIIALLDGLDEVEKDHRDACAQAINTLRQQRPFLSLAVTTRSHDYNALPTNLNLETAVVLQPLNLAQIDTYLASLGNRLSGMRAALQTDPTLRELAQSPLMLSIMTLAYYRMPADVALSLSDQQISRSYLFGVYVERMTRYREGDKHFDPADSVRWLAWLASNLTTANQTLFFLENVQPNWLPRDMQRRFVDQLKLRVGLLLASGGIFGGLIGLLTTGWTALLWGTGLGILLALLVTLGNRYGIATPVNWYRIDTTETISWDWPRALWSLLGGGGVGLALGGLITWLTPTDRIPWLLLLPLLFGGWQILEHALIRNEMKLRTTPGQGIAQSRRNGLLIGGIAVLAVTGLLLAATAVWTLFTPYPIQPLLPWIIGGGLSLGVLAGLLYGGLAYWQHQRLHQRLHQLGLAPADWIFFLDYAAERNLLRKVGGGYLFSHALLLDYFATLGKGDPP